MDASKSIAVLDGEYVLMARVRSPQAVIGEVEHVHRSGGQTLRTGVAELCAYAHPGADRTLPHWCVHLFTWANRRYDARSRTTTIVSDPERQAGPDATRLHTLLKLRDGDLPAVHPELGLAIGRALADAGWCTWPMRVHVHASIEQRQIELGQVFHDDD